MRDREEELAQQEDEEGVAEEGRDGQRQDRVHPAEAVEDDVLRDHGDLEGQHHRRQDEEEDAIAARPAHVRERVGGGRAGEQAADDDQQRDLERVGHVAAEGDDLDGLGEVVEVDRARDPDRRPGEDLAALLEGGAEQPGPREQEEEHQWRHRQVGEPADPLVGRPLAGGATRRRERLLARAHRRSPS